MKIEKLTDNKIRIIIRNNEIKYDILKKKEFLFSTPEFKEFFLNALDKAEKELDFSVKDCKLLIELFYHSKDTYVFTVTKYLDADSFSTNDNFKNSILKTLPKKYKLPNTINNDFLHIFSFDDFENFCMFCNFIDSSNINLRGLFKSAVLYFYDDKYFLVVKDLNYSNKFYHSFKASLLEFGDKFKYTGDFEFKLKEHGKVAIKNNAIRIGIKYF